MKKSVYLINIFLFNLSAFNLALAIETKLPDNPNNSSNQANKNGHNYTLSEKEARDKIYNTIGKKFGNIKKYSISLIWPFITEKIVEGVKLTNSELREIKNIAEENLKSSASSKIVLARKAFITYVTQVVIKPIQQTTIKWKEIETLVPVTNFKDVERKRYDENKLKHSIYSKIVESISKKSYDYTLEKTGKANIAETIQKYIAKDLWQKIKSEGTSLQEFLGKLRWKKLDQLIDNIIKRGSPDKNQPNKPNK
jgi:hypothetical protein